MTDFREEAYIIEKAEISEDSGDGSYQYEEIKDSDEEKQTLPEEDDEDDLNDFDLLKQKTTLKQAMQSKGAESVGTMKLEARPKVVERDVVIDDYIRNFLKRFGLENTINVFQQEWHELQKKGTFNDVGLGLITDTEDKNRKLTEKVTKMKKELEQAKVVAEEAKSTWEKLRKERDFHKTHQNRVEGEKVQINQGIKKIKDLHEQYEDRLEEIQHKYEQTLKEKALLKLEKDKLAKRINTITKTIKDQQDKVTKEIEDNHKKAKLAAAAANRSSGMPVKGKNTPWPEDARPNPFLAKTYEDLNPRPQFQKKVDAHQKAIGGFALHLRKQIIATASDDCKWKIFNMENGENIMTGEGHKDWISAIDFHPAGSHLVTGGADKCIKVWDFINSSIAHTFTDCFAGAIWKTKFHDTGDFVLSSADDGAIKLFDLNSLKLRQQFRAHTDSVNGLNFQPFTNFFVSGSADKTISIWDMRTGLTVQTFYGHLNTVNDTQFSIGGQYVASCDSDGIVKVWDIRSVQEINTVDCGDIVCQSLAFDKNSKNLFIGCNDREVKVLNIEKNEIIHTMKGHDAGVNGVVVNQDNSTVYTAGSDGTIRIWR